MTAAKQAETENFSFASSVKADIWHPRAETNAYEWWYFDALSDDGKDAIVVIFLDNFIFSPGYNRLVQSSKFKVQSSKSKSQNAGDNQFEIQNPKSQIERFPAVVFIYYHNGKPLYRAINEFPAEAFSASEELPACRMGENSFAFESAPYGSGYSLSIKMMLRWNRLLEAKLEWLSIESDFLPNKDFGNLQNAHNWNLVAARSDVTGSVKVTDAKGKTIDTRHFRGTGYHDHNLDARWLPACVKDWQWGRAHFADATAVFYRYRELEAENAPVTKLFLIKNNELKSFDALYEERKMRRSLYGLKFPKEIAFSTAEGVRLSIKQIKPVDESFFYLRFLSEAKLASPDSDIRRAFAITEHLVPRALKYRWLDWLVKMRIGRKGKGSFL